MRTSDQSNPQFELAVQFVNNTCQNIFLTGKAGTGKTTFLKYIREHTPKKLAVVAPTGIAAINAGGVTLHSFFQLPFGSFLPAGSTADLPNANFFNRYSLMKHLRFTGMKRRIIQELDLLVIDEVSMVRSDLLDAIDTILRHIRQQEAIPFGGVQMLFIGDLLQLPPVVKEEEWKELKQHYKSPFFFDAHVLQAAPPHYLELKKIYRQSDENFIRVLNRLRNNQLQAEDLILLHQYYQPDFKPVFPGEYITLTTHNTKAEEINQRELKKLPGKLYTFTAEVQGDFNEKSVTAETVLTLREGAQVMFIKNDKGEVKRFFNGKLATIKKLSKDGIRVVFPDTRDEIEVEVETWKNVRYTYNKESDSIQEEVLGTFSQYPLRLAWAITIHKSQGLTFSKAVVDAGDSFAPGQVYVALSRLTSLDGLVLHSKIGTDCINTDLQAMAYAGTEKDSSTLMQHLQEGQKDYIHTLLLNVFRMNFLLEQIKAFAQGLEDRRLPFADEAAALAARLVEKTTELQATSEKFIVQLQQLLPLSTHDNYKRITERTAAAGSYFTEALFREVFTPLNDHFESIKKRQKIKQYCKVVLELAQLVKRKKFQLSQAMQLTAGLTNGTDATTILQEIRTAGKNAESQTDTAIKEKPGKGKVVKGDSHRQSLELFKAGKTVREIGLERGLAATTVEGHLASFIATGEVNVLEVVNEHKAKAIQQVIKELGEAASGIYKEKLGADYSYGEIRAVLNHLKRNLELAKE